MFNIDESTSSNEETGVWTAWRGSQFLIASAGSLSFQRLFQRLQRPHRKAIDKGTLDPQIQNELMAKALSKTILLGWKDVVDGSGKTVAYSQEAAYNVLLNNGLFREFITEFATELGNFESEEKEELGKSAEMSSSGSLSTESD